MKIKVKSEITYIITNIRSEINADRHAKGKCTIILIRRLEEPEVPFYTMELVGPEKRIIQVRGNHNCGMTQEVEAFVESYKKYLAEVGKKKGAKAA